MVRRGDVVLVHFPFTDGSGSKFRPAVVVQRNADNRRLNSTIVALVTRTIGRAEREPTQFLIVAASNEGKQTGLQHNSAVICGNLYTLHLNCVRHHIGQLAPTQLHDLDACLKIA
jgi:mRNA interferase MazF